jgi:cytochrome c
MIGSCAGRKTRAPRERNAMSWWPMVCLLLVAGTASMARAQLPFTIPKPAPLTAAGLFANHCGICHTIERDGPPRQGPNLAGVFLRKAGTLPGFRYSPGFAQAEFVWDDEHLDTWLADPQKLIPGAAMKYRQADPAIRSKIIAWLKEQH